MTIINFRIYTILTSSQLAEADLASQARNTAGLVGQGLQSSAVAAGTTFNRFVEGSDAPAGRRRNAEPEQKDFWDSFGAPAKGPAEDKKDFWDEFASAGETRAQAAGAAKTKPSGIGTSAMKKPAPKKEEEGWGDW